MDFFEWHIDSCPSQFNQIYSIHDLKFQQSEFIDYSKFLVYVCRLDFPCVISLLSGKSTDTYLQLFSELEQHAERLNKKFDPRHVMSDFEMSSIKAVKQKVCVF
jgi:hypothetical protein